MSLFVWLVVVVLVLLLLSTVMTCDYAFSSGCN